MIVAYSHVDNRSVSPRDARGLATRIIEQMPRGRCTEHGDPADSLADMLESCVGRSSDNLRNCRR